jgi:hypothetical protein
LPQNKVARACLSQAPTERGVCASLSLTTPTRGRRSTAGRRDPRRCRTQHPSRPPSSPPPLPAPLACDLQLASAAVPATRHDPASSHPGGAYFSLPSKEDLRLRPPHRSPPALPHFSILVRIAGRFSTPNKWWRGLIHSKGDRTAAASTPLRPRARLFFLGPMCILGLRTRVAAPAPPLAAEGASSIRVPKESAAPLPRCTFTFTTTPFFALPQTCLAAPPGIYIGLCLLQVAGKVHLFSKKPHCGAKSFALDASPIGQRSTMEHDGAPPTPSRQLRPRFPGLPALRRRAWPGWLSRCFVTAYKPCHMCKKNMCKKNYSCAIDQVVIARPPAPTPSRRHRRSLVSKGRYTTSINVICVAIRSSLPKRRYRVAIDYEGDPLRHRDKSGCWLLRGS